MKKQKPVAVSSCEKEHQGLSGAAQEVFFLRQLICDSQHLQQQETFLGKDIQSAIKPSTNPLFHKRSKHIDVKQDFLRDAVQKDQKDEITILHVPVQKTATDIFTKGLCEAKFTDHHKNFTGTVNPTSSRV